MYGSPDYRLPLVPQKGGPVVKISALHVRVVFLSRIGFRSLGFTHYGLETRVYGLIRGWGLGDPLDDFAPWFHKPCC